MFIYMHIHIRAYVYIYTYTHTCIHKHYLPISIWTDVQMPITAILMYVKLSPIKYIVVNSIAINRIQNATKHRIILYQKRYINLVSQNGPIFKGHIQQTELNKMAYMIQNLKGSRHFWNMPSVGRSKKLGQRLFGAVQSNMGEPHPTNDTHMRRVSAYILVCCFDKYHPHESSFPCFSTSCCRL